MATNMSEYIGKALIVIGDASETLDTLYPFYRLQEARIQPVVIAPEKRLYQMVMHEIRPGWTITKEWEGYQLQADLAFSEVNPEEYLGIMFSGGRAPEYIREDPDLIRITQWFFDQNKRSPVFVTVSKSLPEPTGLKAVAWQPWQNVSLTWKYVEGPTSMKPVLLMATLCRDELFMTMVNTSDHGSKCSKRLPNKPPLKKL